MSDGPFLSSGELAAMDVAEARGKAAAEAKARSDQEFRGPARTAGTLGLAIAAYLFGSGWGTLHDGAVLHALQCLMVGGLAGAVAAIPVYRLWCIAGAILRALAP